MLEFSAINFWAIPIAWFINVIVGAYWYSPIGFGKQWTRHTGIDHMKMPEKQATQTVVFIALSALVQVVTLAVVIRSLHAVTAVDGLVVGLLLWFGLTAVTTIGNTLYSRLSWKFWWLNSSYFLVVMAINSIIFALWR